MIDVLRSIAVFTSNNEFFIKTISAESIAISVPCPMATPISARIKAGASLIPSPTIITLRCSLCNLRMTLSLSAGNTSEITSSICNPWATALAVLWLSPVNITTWRPFCLNSWIAALLVLRIVSATAIIPSASVLSVKIKGVFPSSASFSISFSLKEMPFSLIKTEFPAKYVCPSIFALPPFPPTASNSSTLFKESCFCFALLKIAKAKGCSLPCSIDAAKVRKASSDISLYLTIFWIDGFPEVIVPVLSKTIVSTLCNVSRLWADLIKIPWLAALPVPTIIATGVAKPKAQGQEITNTLIALDRANSKLCLNANQTIAVTMAIPITIGTKIPLTLSANLAIGALEFPASSTRRMICARVVSSPTFNASNLNEPFWFKVAEITISPGCFSTGMLSPVIVDWSTYPVPEMIFPSTGIFWPGLMTTISPCITSDADTSISFPSRMTVALFGARSTNLLKASVVFDLDLDSKYFPTLTNVTIIAADSKYKACIAWCTISIFP